MGISLRITEVDIIFKTEGTVYCYFKRVDVIKSYKIKKTGRGVRKRLEEAVRWSVEGMTQMEIAARIGVSQPAINKWMKKPEWIEIEERLKEEKARAFMESYNEKTKETFKRLQENAEKLAFAFAQDAASSLKIAQIAKMEALEKVESKKLSPLKASEKTVSTTYHQRAASSSSRESREIAEQFYCISKIIEVMDKEGLLNEDNESGEISED